MPHSTGGLLASSAPALPGAVVPGASGKKQRTLEVRAFVRHLHSCMSDQAAWTLRRKVFADCKCARARSRSLHTLLHY